MKETFLVSNWKEVERQFDGSDLDLKSHKEILKELTEIVKEANKENVIVKCINMRCYFSESREAIMSFALKSVTTDMGSLTMVYDYIGTAN